MRLAFLAAVAAAALATSGFSACSGSRGASAPPGPPAVARDYAATRWIPAAPSYAFAARTVRDVQRGARDAVDALGLLVGADAGQVGILLDQLLAVNPLSPDAVSAIGVDLDGGFAMFSEEANPTFVVHLRSPDQLHGFLDQLRVERKLVTQSMIVDGHEVFSAELAPRLRLSWVVVRDWMWLHLALPGVPETGAAWFTGSLRPGAPRWTEAWTWAQRTAGGERPALVGFVDLPRVIYGVAPRLRDISACHRVLVPGAGAPLLGRVALALHGDGKQAGGRIAIDLGPAAAAVARAVLPAPEGWAAASAGAALAVQWNVDLFALRDWLDPCRRALGVDLARLDELGVRSARVILHRFDPDDRSGAGALSFDLAHRKFFTAQLDRIPLRAQLETSRQFGPYPGKSLSIPFGPTIDYVLTDSVMLAGAGDGLLARAVGRGPGAPGPLLTVDLAPPALSRETWAALLDRAWLPRPAQVAERLVRWRDGHISLVLDGTRLVLSATGTRR